MHNVMLLAVGMTVTTLTHSDPFTSLNPPFTQSVYASHQLPDNDDIFGGIAFASDGDVLVADCKGYGATLFRFDEQSTETVNGTAVHPLVDSNFANIGCGITNHPNGSIYSNTSRGVTRINPESAELIGGPFGAIGNALGIAVEPATGNLVYVTSTGVLNAVDAELSNQRIFSAVFDNHGIDGIYFAPQGGYLFAAIRDPSLQLGIINAQDGSLVQVVDLTSPPDGVAFRASAPHFVVTINLDGTLTRIDFANDDFAQTATLSTFASGGFRGDLSEVGRDGCLYLSQSGTRFDDGSTSGAQSVVKICSGFAQPSSIFKNDFDAGD